MPFLIRELLAPNCINLALTGPSEAEAISNVAKLLKGKRGVLSLSGLKQDVLTRERLSPTGIGNLLAIPHARTDHVDRIVMAVGRCETPIDFDGEPARLIFMIGIPRTMPAKYLSLIGAFGRLAHNEQILNVLLHATTTKQFLAALPKKI